MYTSAAQLVAESDSRDFWDLIAWAETGESIHVGVGVFWDPIRLWHLDEFRLRDNRITVYVQAASAEEAKQIVVEWLQNPGIHLDKISYSCL